MDDPSTDFCAKVFLAAFRHLWFLLVFGKLGKLAKNCSKHIGKINYRTSFMTKNIWKALE
jgi:hypothetical protein